MIREIIPALSSWTLAELAARAILLSRATRRDLRRAIETRRA
jgi:hypothetical protein